MSDLSALAWSNGRFLPVETIDVSIASISFHMGTGVFDGMMAYDLADSGHHIFRGLDHFKRFKSGSANMGLEFEWSPEDLLDAAAAIIEGEIGRTCYIRPIAYRGGAELWLTGAENRPTDVSIFAIPLEQTTLGKPIRCGLSDVRRISSAAIPVQWKVCGLYANSFLVRRGAEAAGYDDGIMLDSQGRVAEASAANIFFLNDEGLSTPDLSADVFPGITRQTVLEICQDNGLPCGQTDIGSADLSQFSGAFLCSTLMEIRPLVELQGRSLSTISDPRYQMILERFREMTRGLS